MSIVGGFDVHRKQITFDYVDTDTGEVSCGQIASADRRRLAEWLATRFAGRDDVAFAAEACTGWRYVIEELQHAGGPDLAEPAETAAARGRKRRAKTDRTDARLLRTLLDEGRLPECYIPPTEVLEYRALLELYQDLRREHTAWLQRIHARNPAPQWWLWVMTPPAWRMVPSRCWNSSVAARTVCQVISGPR